MVVAKNLEKRKLFVLKRCNGKYVTEIYVSNNISDLILNMQLVDRQDSVSKKFTHTLTKYCTVIFRDVSKIVWGPYSGMHKFKKLISRKHDPKCWAIDAFRVSWTFLYFSTFPLVSLILRTFSFRRFLKTEASSTVKVVNIILLSSLPQATYQPPQNFNPKVIYLILIFLTANFIQCGDLFPFRIHSCLKMRSTLIGKLFDHPL